jgi:2'-5' RNA ligase
VGTSLACGADLEGPETHVSEAGFESALIVSVPEAEPCVRHHRFRYDAVALRGVPAHITILFPFMPPEEITDEALDGVRQVLTRFSAFRFSLTRLERFPEGALYLAPDPAEPFVRLTAALVERFPTYRPYGGAYADVIPHLTVAQLPGAATVDEVSDIRSNLPIQSEAREILLMAEGGDRRWHMRSQFALDGRNRM